MRYADDTPTPHLKRSGGIRQSDEPFDVCYFYHCSVPFLDPWYLS